jgi:hypothetical protein
MAGMVWTAPTVDRPAPPYVGDERAILVGWLDYHRATLLYKCAGLTADQLALRPMASSTMSLLGLVRHLAEVERVWFRWRLAGESVGPMYGTGPTQDACFDGVDPVAAEEDFADYAAEVAAARAAVLGRPLDAVSVWGKSRTESSVRGVFVHMIEEYARHNGHADLIRELIDGATGR